jgi:hypothetical protein
MEESCFFIYGLTATRYCFEYMEMYLFAQGPYRAVNSDRDLTNYFVCRRKF